MAVIGLTNPAALVATQSLVAATSGLAATQNAVSTGLSVAGVQDDSAAFSIAQTVRADIGGLNATFDSLSRASGTLDVASSAASSISNLLIEARGVALAASDPSLDAASLGALSADFGAIVSQIDSLAASAGFNGTNLVDGSGGSVAVPAGPDGSGTAVAVSGADLTGAGLGLTTTSFGSAADAQAALGELDAALPSVNATLSGFGAASSEVDLQFDFLTQLQDTLTVGVGNLVDADLGEESVDLATAQVQAELAIIGQNIANAAPSALLSLF